MASQVEEQLPLRVQLRDDATFDNFYSSDAQEFASQIKLSAAGVGEQSIFISGPSGSGCSHLLQAACHEAESTGLNSVYLPLDELVNYSPAIFESLEGLPLIALDNVQAVAGLPEWEEALFHLFNRVRDSGGRMLFAADNSPDQLGIKLPDLLSRLIWGLVYAIDESSAEFKMVALQFRAKNRGMDMTDEVAKFVVKNVGGQMESMFNALQKLDNASLSAKKKLSRPFVKNVMGW
jgi:DnaA family protein